ncbi:hypothetical protein FJZ23_00680 [Candidatus Parcubacteria bacterium]|nr:hypothetical protein [Candidatus Parcubacteria bacterium]
MAKKGRKSIPVPPMREDENVIRIKREIPKFRSPVMSGGGQHHTREDDVRKGRSRKPKHRGRADW